MLATGVRLGVDSHLIEFARRTTLTVFCNATIGESTTEIEAYLTMRLRRNMNFHPHTPRRCLSAFDQMSTAISKLTRRLLLPQEHHLLLPYSFDLIFDLLQLS